MLMFFAILEERYSISIRKRESIEKNCCPFCFFLVHWSPQRTLVPSFFYLSVYLSIYLSAIFPFTCNFMWFIKLRASAGMCGICMGVCWCVWVCAGVLGCARVCSGVLRCAGVCVGVHGCAQVQAKVHTCMWVWLGGWVRYARVCMGVCGSVQKCEGVCKCVCWMNFQNIFWRLDSIHQRTLIRILYEFFL